MEYVLTGNLGSFVLELASWSVLRSVPLGIVDFSSGSTEWLFPITLNY
jgi:hypothetical protein